jgi:hypothetical protein
MCAVPSAAGREIHVGGGHKGENRRDQREAEEEKEDDAGEAPHHAIVARFIRGGVRKMSVMGLGTRLNFSGRQGSHPYFAAGFEEEP